MCNSTYQSRRSREWLKIKTGQRQEVVIAGFTKPRGSRQHFGSLVLGVYAGKDLLYIGCVGTGFNQTSLAQLHATLKKITRTSCPFKNQPKITNLASWVKPQLICEVVFAEWTQEGLLRQPVFKGLRQDKYPKDVIREKTR
jgi:bifunctional non-homologous end joining protein LigD